MMRHNWLKTLGQGLLDAAIVTLPLPNPALRVNSSRLGAEGKARPIHNFSVVQPLKEIPLGEAEQAAVEDSISAYEISCRNWRMCRLRSV
jgi:hypothetical protein